MAADGHLGLTVKLSLDNNANVYTKITSGDTPVNAARRNHHLDIVEFLMKVW